ncbi:hypothetical protein MKW98_031658 [Papaver atlanticum]|uniref:Transcription factor GTE4 n=1 Tax=Papaver atlanticum TaxID=357466 RepID=A0AAD4X865_9MAGN|nr:hypothetical protein MKW98_031658 [Papaver atlanticum]
MASKSLNRGSGGDRSSKVYSRKSQNNNKISSKNLRQPTSSKKTLEKQPPQLSRFDAAASDDSSSLNRRQLSSRGDADTAPPSIYTFPLQLENRIIINVSTKLKQELREIRRKLIIELDQVRNLVKKLEAKESQLSSASNNYSNSQLSRNYVADNGGGGSGSVKREKFKAPLPRLSVSSMEDSQLTDNNAQKETNKKAKLNSGKKRSGVGNGGFGLDKNSCKVFKNCSDLLAKLMKHKHGWVFNTPVDVKGLGLRDYYVIIKKPMDLGTVKNKLNKNGYKSPSEFAEDVKLTFDNAMTYNRKGQDVHIMAEELLKIFEDKWVGIQAESNRKSKSIIDHEVGVPKSKSIGKRSFSPPHPPETKRNFDRSESPIVPVNTQLKPSDAVGSGRISAPKKPKASDINKREMTYEEKQRLSTNLQSLPLDKLDNVVQIIKNRNSSLLHNDDEIEVDIDSVDTETLWELDRFVTNYRKGLGKKRKAENAIQPTKESEQIVEEAKPDPPTVEPPKDKEIALDINEKDMSSSSPVQERREEAATRSSSSSSSSSDSGSSSSDSDTDSSSASDS